MYIATIACSHIDQARVFFILFLNCLCTVRYVKMRLSPRVEVFFSLNHGVCFIEARRKQASLHCSRLFRVIVKCSTCIINGIIGYHSRIHFIASFHMLVTFCICTESNEHYMSVCVYAFFLFMRESSYRSLPALYLYLCKCAHTSSHIWHRVSLLYKSILIKHLYMRTNPCSPHHCVMGSSRGFRLLCCHTLCEHAYRKQTTIVWWQKFCCLENLSFEMKCR